MSVRRPLPPAPRRRIQTPELLDASSEGRVVSPGGGSLAVAEASVTPTAFDPAALRKLRRVRQAVRMAGEDGDGVAGARVRRTAGAAFSTTTFPGYEVLEEIFRGGQGVVYLAIQQTTGRRVAIKVLRGGGAADARSLRRFEREVRILAQLKHPNIVTIHDSDTAGSTAYFVMDYIEGRPLDAFVAEEGLDVRQTLELFAVVCDAVHAAHGRGVVHRDLKPGNIRVDHEGRPHVLDFGLAKLDDDAGGRRPERTVTVPGHFVGSLPWASPEQVDETVAGAIDARTDVYALGVILFQLLTGSFPYDVTGGTREAMDHIVETPPRRPRSLAPQVNDEVETILLKCLAKMPERRHPSAGELACEIRRYLRGEPIESKRDSAWYVLRKTLRRYRIQAAAIVMFCVLNAAFGVTMSVLYHRTADAEASARRQARSSELASRQLDDLLLAVQMSDEKGDPAIITEGAEAALRDVQHDPLAQAMVMGDVANILKARRLHDAEVEWRQRAVEACLDRRWAGPLDEATARHALGWALHGALRFADGEAELRRALDLRRRTLGAEHIDVADSLLAVGESMSKQGRPAEAETLLREALDLRLRLRPEPHQGLIKNLLSLSALADNNGKTGYVEAETLARRALAIASELYPGDHPVRVGVMLRLAGVLDMRSRFDDALALQQQALASIERLYPSGHPRVAASLEGLGLLLKDMGRYDDAERHIRAALEAKYAAAEGRVGGRPGAAHNWHSLAKVLTDSGRFDEAEAACRTAIEVHIEDYGADHRNTARPMTHLGRILTRMGRYEDAIPYLVPALEIRLRTKPEGHWKTAKTMSILGTALTGVGRYEEAESLLLDGFDDIEADRGYDHRRTREAIERIVFHYETRGLSAEAIRWQAELALRGGAPLDAPFPKAAS